MVLHGRDATAVGYKRIVVKCRDTEQRHTSLYFCYCYHLGDCNTEVWMLPETNRIIKCVAAYLVTEQLSQSVLSEILNKILLQQASVPNLFLAKEIIHARNVH